LHAQSAIADATLSGAPTEGKFNRPARPVRRLRRPAHIGWRHPRPG